MGFSPDQHLRQKKKRPSFHASQLCISRQVPFLSPKDFAFESEPSRCRNHFRKGWISFQSFPTSHYYRVIYYTCSFTAQSSFRQIFHPPPRYTSCVTFASSRLCPFWFSFHLGSNADDATSRPATGISRHLALLVTAPTEIVGAGMHDDGPAEDALGPNQLDELVGDRTLGVALTVGLVVAEITDVADVVGGGAMLFGVGVDCVGKWRAASVSGCFSLRERERREGYG